MKKEQYDYEIGESEYRLIIYHSTIKVYYYNPCTDEYDLLVDVSYIDTDRVTAINEACSELYSIYIESDDNDYYDLLIAIKETFANGGKKL
jgi:hypothetical protein